MGLSPAQSTKATLAAAASKLQGQASSQTQPADSRIARAQNAGTVIAVVVIGVVTLVGILIMSEVNNALPADHALNGTSDDIITGFGDAMGLVPIIMLVLLASVVIAVVNRMRGGGM
jgi:hypothetical protein